MHTPKRFTTRVGRLLPILLLTATASSAHPGTAIVVDAEGHVYIVQTFKGVWKIGPEGDRVPHEGPGWHFAALDPEGKFSEHRWGQFLEPVRPGVVDYGDSEIRAAGSSPTLLLASSFPIAMGGDGALYYAEPDRDENMYLMRQDVSGPPTQFAKIPVPNEIHYDGTPGKALWIHGLAAGPEGSLYYAEKEAVRRVNADGTVTTIADKIKVPGCAGHERGGPILRGLDVDDDGTVYVAAMACAAVVRITPDGGIESVLEAEESWTPTGIVTKDGNLYVLEVWHEKPDQPESWRPRVRIRSRDGSVRTLATITEE